MYKTVENIGETPGKWRKAWTFIRLLILRRSGSIYRSWITILTRKKEIENFQKGKDCVYFYRYEEYEADSPMKPSWTMRSEQGFRDYKSCCDHFRREVEEEYQEERKQKLRNLQIERYDLAGTIRCKTASVNTRIQLTDFEPSPFQEEDRAGAVRGRTGRQGKNQIFSERRLFRHVDVWI